MRGELVGLIERRKRIRIARHDQPRHAARVIGQVDPADLDPAAHDFERRTRVVGHQSPRQRLALKGLSVGK